MNVTKSKLRKAAKPYMMQVIKALPGHINCYDNWVSDSRLNVSFELEPQSTEDKLFFFLQFNKSLDIESIDASFEDPDYGYKKLNKISDISKLYKNELLGRYRETISKAEKIKKSIDSIK